MAKKTSFSELTDITQFIELLKVAESHLKGMIEMSAKVMNQKGDTGKDIIEKTKAIENAKIAEKGLSDTQKERLALEVKANEIRKQTKKELEDEVRALSTKQQAEKGITENQKKIIENQKKIAEQRKEAKRQITEETSAYARLSNILAANQKKWLDLAAAGRENTKEGRQLLKVTQQQDAAIKKLDATIGRSQRNVGNYASAFKVLGSIIGAFGIGTGIYLVSQIGRDIFNNTVELDRYNKALKQVSRSTADFNRSQGFIKDLADELGSEIFSLTDAYIKFKAATNGTNLEGEKTEKIFRSVAKSGAAMGLSAEDQAGTLKALGQMISKGKIQAEELRGQLGDRLPGALQIMSRAMGVTTQQLDKMMKKGELYAEEVLPLMAKEMEKTFGVDNENRISTLRSEVNRLGNTWKTMFDSGDGVEESTLAWSLKYLILLTNELLKATEFTAKGLKAIFVDPLYDNFFRDFDAEKVDNMIKTGSNIVQKELKRIGEEMSKMTDEQAKIYKTSKFKWYNDIIISNNEEIKHNNIKIAQYKNLGGAWSETADKLILRNKMLAASSKSSVELLEGLNKLSVKKAPYEKNIEERTKAIKEETKAIKDNRDALDIHVKAQEEWMSKRMRLFTESYEHTLKMNELEFELSEKQLIEMGASQEYIDKRRIKFEIDQKQARIDFLKKYFNDLTEEEKKEEGQSIDRQIQILNKEIDILKIGNAAKIQEQKEYYNELLEITLAYLQKQNEAKLKANDQEISESEKKQDYLRQLAIKGTQGSAEALAFEEKKQAELQQKKLKLEERKRVYELVNSGIAMYTAKIQEGNTKDASTSTVADIGKMIAGIKAISKSYYVGTDYVEGVDKTKTGNEGANGEHIAKIHEGEMILEKNKVDTLHKIGIFTRKDLMRAVTQDKTVIVNDNSLLRQDIQELKSAIENKPTYLGMDFDKQNQAVIHIIEQKNKIVRNHKKLKI